MLQEESQQILFRAAGRAYAEGNLKSGDRQMRRVVAASGNSTLAQQIASRFRTRLRSLADRAVEEAIRKGKPLLRDRDKSAADQLAQAVSGKVEFASESVSGEWQKLQAKIAQPGQQGQQGQPKLMKRMRS